MRKLFLSLFFLPTLALAQNPTVLNKEVVCDKLDVIMSALTKDYQEKPFWLGKDEETKSNYVLMVNSGAGSWTIVQFNEKIACIIGSGTGHYPIQNQSKFKIKT